MVPITTFSLSYSYMHITSSTRIKQWVKCALHMWSGMLVMSWTWLSQPYTPHLSSVTLPPPEPVVNLTAGYPDCHIWTESRQGTSLTTDLTGGKGGLGEIYYQDPDKNTWIQKYKLIWEPHVNNESDTSHISNGQQKTVYNRGFIAAAELCTRDNFQVIDTYLEI